MLVSRGVFQGQIWRVTQQEALMRRRVIGEPAPLESRSKGDTQMRRTVLTSLHQMKVYDSCNTAENRARLKKEEIMRYETKTFILLLLQSNEIIINKKNHSCK